MAEGNPFGAPLTGYMDAAASANPFESFGGSPNASFPAPTDQYGSTSTFPAQRVDSSMPGQTMSGNPFSTESEQSQYLPQTAPGPGYTNGPPQFDQNPYGDAWSQQGASQSYVAPPAPQPATPQYNQEPHNPFGGPVQASTPSSAAMYENALVPSQFQSNPYAVQQNYYSPPHGGQAIVPAVQQTSPWAMGSVSSASFPPAAGGNPFDPFAPPQQSPAPEPQPPMQQPFTQQFVAPGFAAPQPQAPGFPAPQPQAPGFPAPLPQPPEFAAPLTQAPDFPAPHSHSNEPRNALVPAEPQRIRSQSAALAPSSPRTPVREERSHSYAHEGHRGPDNALVPSNGPGYPSGRYHYGHRPELEERDRDVNDSPRNPYSSELARRAPPGASPLPKADLVRKKGFVLSRISFRTIVMKKWKQSFWVQYGPHTMLWFRSQGDFDDWLNNPYHNQTQRNFLIKLAVNFVHDLYKPNVRGYQVTQCRTKAYGKKMIRQFKLERWMDYGPTIAAAFGSYNPKEVDDLREALVECMRNTPLTGGLRATGAVRMTEEERRRRDEENGVEHEDRSQSTEGDQTPRSDSTPKGGGGTTMESVAEETDLLDLDQWDAAPNQGVQPGPEPHAGNPQPAASGPYGGPPPQYPPQHYQQQGQPPQYQQPGPPQQYQQPGPPQQYQQQGQPQQYPPQQHYPPQAPQPYSQGSHQPDPYFQNAMVPVGPPQAYPGAPPVPQTQYYSQMPQQPQVAPQDPWTPSPQQQSTYGGPNMQMQQQMGF